MFDLSKGKHQTADLSQSQMHIDFYLNINIQEV